MHLAVAHGWSVAQPHLITLSTSMGAIATPSDTVTGSSDLEASSSSQPKFVGASSGGSFSNAAFHTDTWKCVRLTFCSNASDVGGRDFSFGAPVAFLFDGLPIHTSYLDADILSLLAHPYHLATNWVASSNTSSIGISVLPIFRSLQPGKSTLIAFAFPIPHMKATVSLPVRA